MSTHHRQWGRWALRTDHIPATLEYSGDTTGEWFSIGDIKSAHDVLGELFRINDQPWASAQAIKQLLGALEELLDASDDYRPRKDRMAPDE